MSDDQSADKQPAAQEKAPNEERILESAKANAYTRALRLKRASQFEMTVYFMIFLLIFLSKLLIHGPIPRIEYLTEADVVVSTSFLTVAAFFYILTGTSPLVGIVNTLISLELGAPSLKIRGPLGLELGWPGPPQDESKPVDPLRDRFVEYIQRSKEAADGANRRPNALLFAGTIIAFFGLVFFLMTLPGSKYGIFDNTPAATLEQARVDFWSSLMQLVPRLLMLIFIQVLAGFFLRQYRSSMEEFRYYEAILRHREAQFLSYELRNHMKDNAGLKKFADDVLKDAGFGLLAKGQTTAILEAQRAEHNDVTTMYEKLATLLSGTIKDSKANKQTAEKPKAEKGPSGPA